MNTNTTSTPAWGHELKTDPEVFAAVLDGSKTHEIRRNDRDFKVGDRMRLRETRYTGQEMRGPEPRPLEYTGREVTRVVSHIQEGYGLQPGWVILSFAPGGGKGEAVAGWRLVPLEPTEAMIAAAAKGRILQAYVGAKEKSDRALADKYRAMLYAAPQAECAPMEFMPVGGNDHMYVHGTREAIDALKERLTHDYRMQAECAPRAYDPATQPGSPAFDGAEAYQAHLEALYPNECAPRVLTDGWKLVPHEPTKEMLEAGREQYHRVGTTKDAWQAMYCAAPNTLEQAVRGRK